MMQYTGRAKKVIPRKNPISLELYKIYALNLQDFQISIQSTYPTNFIKITTVLQYIQQFKLESSLFK